MIREFTRGQGVPDEISEVIGSEFYAQDYYDKSLRDTVLGKHSTNLIRVSRYYMMTKPPVVVDFERTDEKFWVEEKRKHFMAKGIVYVPVFIGEILSKDKFATRVKLESRALSETGTERALARVTVEDWMQEPDTLTLIERTAVYRAKDRFKGKKQSGGIWMRCVETCKDEVTEEFRKAARNGRLGYYYSRIESEIAARG